MRRFLVLGHNASSAATFSIKDLAGTGGRIDILVRCVPAAMLVSHGVREGVEVVTLHLGPPEAPKAVRWSSATMRSLRPDERSTAALMERALSAPTTGPVWQPSTEGVHVAVMPLGELLDEAVHAGSALYVLDEAGEDVAQVDIAPDATFVLGDHLGFTPEEREALARRGARPVSVGPVSLQADQCITVLHNHLDRRAPPRNA